MIMSTDAAVQYRQMVLRSSRWLCALSALFTILQLSVHSPVHEQVDAERADERGPVHEHRLPRCRDVVWVEEVDGREDELRATKVD